ncbi:MAG: hypothetical protein LBT31_01995 [Synergistaceae bacterium]|jgi:exopolyphosphatase/guanosine-5'-triphosphate,3'-diphosphate pyrophosphatase|nr:hypothetical protein [Synergistaceae bacterium]
MSVRAVLDIGTNSVKLLVMRETNGGAERLADRVEIARLGEGAAKNGNLSREAMERAAGAIADMTREALSLGCGDAGDIIAVATEAVRKSGNSSEFVDLVAEKSGVAVKIITGDEEAGLSFRAVMSAMPPDAPGTSKTSNVCVFDVGGGSSEMAIGGRSGQTFRRSVPIGALALHNEFFSWIDGPIPDGVIVDAGRRVRRELGDSAARDAVSGISRFVGVGGTIATLASVFLASSDPDAVSGTVLDAAEISRQITLYSSMNVSDRVKIAGLNPKRADIILAGACIVRELTAFADAGALTVLDRGLRYGLMDKLFGLR